MSLGQFSIKTIHERRKWNRVEWVFFFNCRSAMALQSVLLIRTGKQNVEIIDKLVEIEKSKNQLFVMSYILIYLCSF